ncbi:MAG: G5 domain-containing protein [Chloroflexi bacterium]|nr:G5 domain-containing protein [Chloroflexota bacterium]
MNRKILLPLVLALILGGGLLAALEIHKTINVVINGETQPVAAWAFNVNEVLIAAGISVAEGDAVYPPLDSWLHEGETVSIVRASQVLIASDGESRTLLTTERQPANLLSLAGVTLFPGDQVLADGIPVDPGQPLLYARSHSLQVRRVTRITVDDGAQVHSFASTASTLGAALWDAGIGLNNGDQLTPPSDTVLEGYDIHVTLARSREVTIQTQDGIVRARVVAATMGAALAEAGLATQGLDHSIPPEETPIPADGKIRVVRVREAITLEQEPLPFGVQSQPLPEVELDTQQIVQVGEYGLTARRLRVVYEDGEEISRTVEDEWTAREPKPRIVGYGTQVTIRTVSTADGPVSYWRAVEAYATSYSPCRIGIPDTCSYTTASGKTVQKGVIGVIRSWFNYMQGQLVYIPGYGFATVEDIGGGVAGRHWVDLAYSDEAWVGWTRYVTVYFLAPAPANIMWILE